MKFNEEYRRLNSIIEAKEKEIGKLKEDIEDERRTVEHEKRVKKQSEEEKALYERQIDQLKEREMKLKKER